MRPCNWIESLAQRMTVVRDSSCFSERLDKTVHNRSSDEFVAVGDVFLSDLEWCKYRVQVCFAGSSRLQKREC